MRRWMVTATVLATVFLALDACSAEKITTNECNPAKATQGVVKATLNGLEITIDAETGSIVGLKHPDVGTILEASADNAGIIDLAYPVEFYPPLRMASRHSKGAQITKTEDSITIFLPKLGLSKKFKSIGGKVSATVALKAAPDGKSVIMTCEIDNQSDIPVGQVLFPDLMGLLPFAGEDKTKFTCAAFSTVPFQSLKDPDEKQSQFYINSNWAYYSGGGYQFTGDYETGKEAACSATMILDWFDFGSNKGGFSFYPKRWGWDARPKVMLHLSQQTNKLRMISGHKATVAPGTKWQSPQHWLTPHKYGWAEGIKPYRKWATPHFNRKYPVPDHVKKGLGYRTIFMSTATAWAGEQEDLPVFEDDKDIIYKYSDLPLVAKEAKEHGIDELNLWAWGSPWRSKRGLQYPLKTTYPGMGTLEELSAAVKECKQMGVNVNMFLSVQVLEEPMASRLGEKVLEKYCWAYHPDMIPQINPSYRIAKGACYVDTSNEPWRQEVLGYIRSLMDFGFHSLSWDVYMGSPKLPNVYTLSDEIRAIMAKYDRQASFVAESLNNIDIDILYLDYTWNWRNYEDVRPFANVFSAPRLSANIDSSSKDVKLCFVDNVYMNVMPTIPGAPNGSGSIINNRSLAKALKQCSKLRKQFMDYFVSGESIGDCILTTAPDKDFHVSAYTLPDSAVMFVLNTSDSKSNMSLDCDLTNWLKSATGKYEVKIYNIDGKQIGKKGFKGCKWKSTTSKLKGLDIEIYEFTAK